MSSLPNSLSIRLKIILLTTLTLALAVGSVLAIGITTFTNDKIAHLTDYQQTQVQVSANLVEKQIQAILQMTQLMHLNLIHSKPNAVEQIYKNNQKFLFLKSILILSLNQKGTFKKLKFLGNEDENVILYLDQLGWDGLRFFNDPVLLGKVGNNDLGVGTFIRNSEEEGIAYVAIVKPELSITEYMGDVQVSLFNSLGESFSSETLPKSIGSSELTHLVESILDQQSTFGVRKWASKDKDYFISYQRLKFDDLLVLSVMSEKDALLTVRRLLFRSVVMGGSIFLIFLGLAFFLLHRMTAGLKALLLVMEVMSTGKFSMRVDTESLTEDEIGKLATLINLTAEKFQDLTEQAQNEIVQKQNLEIIQSVKNNVLTLEAIEEPNIQVTGKTWMADSYAGSAWYYEKVQDYVIFLICQSELQGVQAALMNAIVRGAMNLFSAQMVQEKASTPKFKSLIRFLNTAIYNNFKGGQKVSAFIGVINTSNGILEMINANYTIPEIYRSKSGICEVLPVSKSLPLGSDKEFDIEPDLFQLFAGDLMICFSSDLFRTLNPKGETLSASKLMEWVKVIYGENTDEASKIAEVLVKKTEAFFGTEVSACKNDITFLVVDIPQSANLSFGSSE